jgi:malonyl CoA-acyl carrier protein transacylase
MSLESVTNEMVLKELIAAQISRPVLWVDLIKRLSDRNPLFVEVGPNSVISRTVKWIDRNIEIMNTSTTGSFLKTVERYRDLNSLK